MNLFPNFGQTFTIDAQIPFAQVAERREPNFIAGLAQALGHCPNERIGASWLSGVTAEVSERMQHNIAKIALIGEPFQVFYRLTQNGSLALHCQIACFGVKKRHNGRTDLLFKFLVRYVGQRF